jgi:hypothetical protein
VLPQRVPLWWLRCDGFFTPSPILRPVKEMAAAFADELSTLDRSVPLTLIGFSFGGLLAIELGHWLHQAGHPVRALLLEAPLPGILPTKAKRRRRGVLAASSEVPSAPPPQRSRRELPYEWALRHWQGLRLLSPRERQAYLLHRAMGTFQMLQMIPRVGQRWYQGVFHWLERTLRPRLEARLAQGQGLPFWHRQWWYYMPHIHDRAMGYEAPAVAFPVCLAGRPSWLATYASSWKALVEGCTLETCETPLAHSHDDVVNLFSARPWAELVRRWTQ